MSRWSGRSSPALGAARRVRGAKTGSRAQVEPLAALVAVFAVGVALSAYAGLLGATLPTPDRDLAEPTVERAERAVTEIGVADPDALPAALRTAPEGYHLNLTLAADNRTWHAGPTPPPSAENLGKQATDAPDATDVATRQVSVRLAPGRIRPGRLRAEVWT